ncbi:MAG: hypothetical protein FWD58_08950 [Firmicutes bacterium]|nr:hypothetical protein [Bacillota bacterium]
MLASAYQYGTPSGTDTAGHKPLFRLFGLSLLSLPSLFTFRTLDDE